VLAIKARYDGNKVVLPGKKHFPLGSVIIIFESNAETDDDRSAWHKFSGQHLSDAYGLNEPDYSKNLVKESNTEYKPLKKAKSLYGRVKEEMRFD